MSSCNQMENICSVFNAKTTRIILQENTVEQNIYALMDQLALKKSRDSHIAWTAILHKTVARHALHSEEAAQAYTAKLVRPVFTQKAPATENPVKIVDI